jgi:hypothetical protein
VTRIVPFSVIIAEDASPFPAVANEVYSTDDVSLQNPAAAMAYGPLSLSLLNPELSGLDSSGI